jgi:hypothetical protein
VARFFLRVSRSSFSCWAAFLFCCTSSNCLWKISPSPSLPPTPLPLRSKSLPLFWSRLGSSSVDNKWRELCPRLTNHIRKKNEKKTGNSKNSVLNSEERKSEKIYNWKAFCSQEEKFRKNSTFSKFPGENPCFLKTEKKSYPQTCS